MSHSTSFWLWLAGAFALGFLIAGILMTYFQTKYLLLKAERKDRTPIFIGGKFFYLVPEHEYILLQTQSNILGSRA